MVEQTASNLLFGFDCEVWIPKSLKFGHHQTNQSKCLSTELWHLGAHCATGGEHVETCKSRNRSGRDLPKSIGSFCIPNDQLNLVALKNTSAWNFKEDALRH